MAVILRLPIDGVNTYFNPLDGSSTIYINTINSSLYRQMASELLTYLKRMSSIYNIIMRYKTTSCGEKTRAVEI